MTTYTAANASSVQQSITPDAAGEVYSVRGSVALPSTLALNDVIEMAKLPEDCVIVDYYIDTDALAASGLAMSVGFTAGTVAEMRAAGALGNASGIQRMDSPLAVRIAPTSAPRTIGLKVTTAGTTPAAGTIGLTVLYRAARYGA